MSESILVTHCGARLVTRVHTTSPKVTSCFTANSATPNPAKRRRANLGQGFAETPVFMGSDLGPGNAIAGPAIIEESFTTIVVYPGWTARVDDAVDYELVKE